MFGAWEGGGRGKLRLGGVENFELLVETKFLFFLKYEGAQIYLFFLKSTQHSTWGGGGGGGGGGSFRAWVESGKFGGEGKILPCLPQIKLFTNGS